MATFARIYVGDDGLSHVEDIEPPFGTSADAEGAQPGHRGGVPKVTSEPLPGLPHTATPPVHRDPFRRDRSDGRGR
jgi:hypothetical protein